MSVLLQSMWCRSLPANSHPRYKCSWHEGLNAFASGNDREPFFLELIIAANAASGIAGKDIEEYGAEIHQKGEAFLKKPKSFKIILNNTYDDANADDEEGAEATVGAATDEKLMAMLMELRLKEAKKKPSSVCHLPRGISTGHGYILP